MSKVIRPIVDVASKLIVPVSIEARRNNLGKNASRRFFEAAVPTPPPPMRNTLAYSTIHNLLCVDILGRESFMCSSIFKHSRTCLKEEKSMYFWSHYATMHTALKKGSALIRD